MTQLGLHWYCAFACLLCSSPWYPCSLSLQVHSYISNHQHELYCSFSVRCCAPTFSHFPWFSLSHIFPNPPFSKRVGCFFFRGGGGGGHFGHIFRRIAFSTFSNPISSPTHHFLELNGCVCSWGGGNPCIILFLEFPSSHFPFQPPLFSPTHHFPEVKFLCVCGGRGHCTFITIFLM